MGARIPRMVGGGPIRDGATGIIVAMDAAAPSSDARTRRWRFVAIVFASLVPASMDLTRTLAQGSRVAMGPLLTTTLGVLVLLAAITSTFELALKHRLSAARCVALACVVAAGVGIGESLLALLLTMQLGWPLVEPGHRSVAIAVRMGAAGAREAERLRSVAELSRLRANLQPHFLFNTLSTVSALVGEEPREARRLIGALGDLLRDSLVESEQRQTLGDEIDWLKSYADILETRHRGSLCFRWEIDEATRDVLVPRLLLQPLVENAVKHGALRRSEGGEVAVRATLDSRGEGRVTCIVEDNGPGPRTGTPRHGALGIDLVTRRLALEYGRAAEFRLERDQGRTRSVVAIPAERAS
jgi:Histidine kinase